MRVPAIYPAHALLIQNPLYSMSLHARGVNEPVGNQFWRQVIIGLLHISLTLLYTYIYTQTVEGDAMYLKGKREITFIYPRVITGVGIITPGAEGSFSRSPVTSELCRTWERESARRNRIYAGVNPFLLLRLVHGCAAMRFTRGKVVALMARRVVCYEVEVIIIFGLFFSCVRWWSELENSDFSL